jgi:NADPH:quinone reductase-like Zn-dependent oxidoreductase
MKGKAAQYTRHGEPRDVIEVIDEETPAPGPGEALLGIEAVCLHIADLKWMRGERGFQRALPRVPGAEGVARVLAVGPGVQGLSEGDRVVLPLGTPACREHLILPAGRLIPVDSAGDVLQLAMASCNPPTSWLLLTAFADHASGDWVLQNCANAACGRYLIQMAKAQGVRTVNVVRRPEVAGELEALGAAAVVIDGEDLPGRVAEVTGGAGIRLGLDAVAGEGTARIAACLAEGGLIVNYGFMSGEDLRVPGHLSLHKGIRLQGFLMSRTFRERYTPADERRIRADLAGQIARGELHAKVAATYPLERIADALEHASRTGADRDGKVIVTTDLYGA